MNIKETINFYWLKLKNNKFFKDIAIVASGNISAKLIVIASAPIITRLYTPEEYGVFTVFMSFVGIVGSLATLRYAVTIPLANSNKLADDILKLCILVTITLSCLLLIVISFFGNTIAGMFSEEKLIPYLWLMPILLLSKGIYEALNNWAVREKKFVLITRTRISQSFSGATFKVGLGYLGIKPLGLFLGQIIQESAGILSLLSKLISVNTKFFRQFSWSDIIQVAKRYRKFPLLQSWSQLLLALSSQLPIVLVGSIYGVREAGIFGLAMNMINLPMDLLGQSVAQVYYAEIAKYGKEKPKQIYMLSVSIIKKMFWIGLLPVILLIALGPWIFKTVFGNDWVDAGIFARYFSSIILFRFISSPLSNIFNLFEKQGLQLTLNIVRVLIVAIVFIISSLLVFTIYNTILLYGIILSIYSLFGIYLLINILKNKISVL